MVVRPKGTSPPRLNGPDWTGCVARDGMFVRAASQHAAGVGDDGPNLGGDGFRTGREVSVARPDRDGDGIARRVVARGPGCPPGDRTLAERRSPDVTH
jgi:hypothetical protein